MQTCYAKWLNSCSGYCEFNATLFMCRVKLSLFFLFLLSYSYFFLFCLLVLPYYMVNKDIYITIMIIALYQHHSHIIIAFARRNHSRYYWS